VVAALLGVVWPVNRSHHQEFATAVAASCFTLERGGSGVVGRGLAG
jgi:hypothetical protein